MPSKAKRPSVVHAPKTKPATKETTVKRARPTSNKVKRINKAKNKRKAGKQVNKVKTWLKTPADWARFDAWAKIKAQPRKIPEPEPIVRASKPFYLLKRRLKVLAKPHETPDPSINCRLDLSVSKAALTARPTKRVLELSLPIVRLCDYGRVFYTVSPAALRYEASERIHEISRPHIHVPEGCEPPASKSRTVDKKRLNKLSLTKKLLNCPEQLTPEEIAEIFTPYGIKRTAHEYKITPWVEYLALPSYKNIKERKDKQAMTWKKRIITEGEERGKSALAEQEKKTGRKRKHEEMEDEEEEKGGGGDNEETTKKAKEKEREAKRRRIEIHAWRYAPYPCRDDIFSVKKGALTGKVPPGVTKLAVPMIRKNTSTRSDEETFGVSKGAMSASASPRVETLAKPTRPRSPVKRRPPREKDEFGSPIFKMPVYGKVLPKTKPYKMGECEPKEKKKVVKRRPIDPIAYEKTYDPSIYPDMARRQKRERKRAAKIKEMGKKRGRQSRLKKDKK